MKQADTLQQDGELADPPWRAEHIVHDRSAVKTLLDLKAIRCLGPFLHGPRTLSEAAAELDMGTSNLAYWIKKLEGVGLITRLPATKRAGMAMPRYRAAGRQLFLPFSSVPPGMTSDLLDGGRKKLLDRFLDGMDEVLRKGNQTGLEFAASGPIGVEIDVREPEDPTNAPWTDFWGTLRLSREVAADFSREMKELMERFRRVEGTGRTDYVVHIGIAPTARFKYRSA